MPAKPRGVSGPVLTLSVTYYCGRWRGCSTRARSLKPSSSTTLWTLASSPAHAMVLGVGVRDPDDIIELLHDYGRRDAAALVVRQPAEATPDVVHAVQESGVSLLALAAGASWNQLAAMLRTLLAEDDISEAQQQTLDGLPAGDLFAVANAVSALVDAPVTIEDRASRVLAFSGRQDEADQSRVRTILGRQVPEQFTRGLERTGIFERLYRDPDPVYIDPRTQGFEVDMPWVAVAVRAGSEILGSIWAAVPGPPPRNAPALTDAAKVVALHMLRLRAGADVERRVRTDLVSTALQGGIRSRSDHPARAPRRPVTVLAMGLTHASPHTRGGRRRPRGRPPTPHGRAGHAPDRGPAAPRWPSSATSRTPSCARPPNQLGGTGGAPRFDLPESTTDHTHAAIGVGSLADDSSDIQRARGRGPGTARTAHRCPTPPRRHHRGRSHRRADLDLADLTAARGDRPTTPLTRLLDYDAQHQTQLMHTLQSLARRVRRRGDGGRHGTRPPEHLPLPPAPSRRGGRHRSGRLRSTIRGHAAPLRLLGHAKQEPSARRRPTSERLRLPA